MIETTGLATPFLFCAVSNLGVAIALVTMKPVQHQTRSEASFYQNLVEGLGYVRRTPAIFGLMGLMSVFALLGRPYVELMPVFARDVLAIGASGLGALNALIGVGSFIGSVAVASLGNYRRKGRLIIGSAIIFSILLTTFSISTWVPLSLVIAPILGFFTLFYMVGTNTLIQSTVPGALRGRVASIYGLVQMGLMPMGIMLEGAVGSLIGVPITVVGGGLVVLVCSGLGLLAVPALRRLE